ncbi:MAG TPA: hypothetical protein P5539_13755 [Mesotoga sp.]|nr:hypothetical protein [Mesotoga sp.]
MKSETETFAVELEVIYYYSDWDDDFVPAAYELKSDVGYVKNKDTFFHFLSMAFASRRTFDENNCTCAKINTGFLVPLNLLFNFSGGTLKSVQHVVGEIEHVAYCKKHFAYSPFKLGALSSADNDIEKEIDFAIHSSVMYIQEYDRLNLTSKGGIAA